MDTKEVLQFEIIMHVLVSSFLYYGSIVIKKNVFVQGSSLDVKIGRP